MSMALARLLQRSPNRLLIPGTFSRWHSPENPAARQQVIPRCCWPGLNRRRRRWIKKTALHRLGQGQAFFGVRACQAVHQRVKARCIQMFT